MSLVNNEALNPQEFMKQVSFSIDILAKNTSAGWVSSWKRNMTKQEIEYISLELRRRLLHYNNFSENKQESK